MQHNERSFSLKTMEDGQVLLYSVRIHPVKINDSIPNTTLWLEIYNIQYFFIEFCKCTGNKNTISVVGVQREDKSELCFLEGFHSCLGLYSYPLWRYHLQRRHCEFFSLSVLLVLLFLLSGLTAISLSTFVFGLFGRMAT